MKAIEIRNKYLEFFKRHGHAVIPSAPLIPENDPSVLFTTAGMQPLVPYLLGEKHPEGTRLTDYQKCVRTNDIDEVGDNRHLTYFEMLGNWSLGDYFKEESIAMSFEFLTKELGIPVEKLSVTCFAGDEDCPRDEIAANAWKKAGILENHIYYYGKDDNWWIAGEEGPCGPDTEMFYDTGKPACSDDCQPSCDCGKYVEIWNNVFMEYFKDKNGYSKLKQKNVDTGLGLERMTMLLQGKETPFDTELFAPIMKKLEELQKIDSIESRRIVAEHLRSSMMIVSDGGRPSNLDRGYVLRRLIRRMIRHMNKLQINLDELSTLIDINVDNLKEMYPDLAKNKEIIKSVILEEKEKFVKTLVNGEREFQKEINKLKDTKKLSGKVVFKLYDTYGFPPEVTKELAKESGYEIDMKEFEELFKAHQEKSRAGSEQKFKGGLAEQNEITIAYHTATHLLNAALKQVIGENAHQRGSNITVDRMRFDFNCDHKMTDEEKRKTEDLVNKWIQEGLPVTKEEMKKEDAIKSGAECMFIEKYPDIVTVYTIGDVSKELCGGPHVNNTKELGKFKIKKEESSSSGVRRIKAVLIKE
ncbi:MAG: alanine--tRNA ligase [Clostridia bacterium]|jgi:alanyl-tRNA synthetase|nr:alanine--tRNA ligase [Clostridia bacterium]MBP8634184.1 alanine--tRNA ligase [Clostridia bacterium]MBP9922082.1 alanine--tRNA ligase [Clostridia bacterium]MED9924160.1 alanine--tRNA ligase [Clostridia bacterium]